jgi:hypothetical protein
MPAGVWHDDGVYVLVGKALADGQGLTYQGVVGAPPAVKFPPVYPGFLAGLWGLLGSVGAVTMVATLANLVLLACAGALLALALRSAAGLPLWAALAAGGLGAVSADVLRTTSAVLSEPLFLAVVAGCLALWPAASARDDHATPARVALALGLLLAIGTRSAGLAVVAGTGLALGLRCGAAVALGVAGPAVAGWLGWSRWAGSRGAQVPADMADLLGPYAGWLREQVVQDPAGFIARMPAHSAGVLERVAVLLVPRAAGLPLWVAATPVLAVALYGWARSVRRFPPLAWSSAAYAGMLLAWPYLDRRLVVPLHVLLVGLIAIGAWELAPRVRAQRVGAVGLALVVGGWAAFYAVVNTHRIASAWPTSAYRVRAERLAVAVEALRRTVPPDAVVGAPEFWAALQLHGGWTVAPSVLFDPATTDAEAPSWGSPESQERLWRSAGIEYLLLEQGGLLNGAALDRLEARCPGEVRVLARIPPMMLVRLPWAVVGRTDGTVGGECREQVPPVP